MAGPSNPFSGPSQLDGATNSAGRGRGSQGRATSHMFKTPHTSRGANTRGRGRGAPSAPRSGRGRGFASNTWRRKPESNTGHEASDTPFAQLKQKRPFSPGPGGQRASQNPPFPRVASSSRGHPRREGTAVDSSRDTKRQASGMRANGTAGAGLENTPALSHYSERYEQLKIDRTKERENAIRQGLMADPNQPTSLNQAITPVGTCTSMCPEFERVERIVQKMVDKSEKFLDLSTNSLQYMETKMLKRFRRSAAGYDEQLPSDIRTPKTLLQTMNYLIRHVVGASEPLGIIHKFVWDRTRSIRNDFSVQQVTQEGHVKIAVTCLERIARFHIVSLHLLSSPANSEPFDRHQEREQLNNTMLSLLYYYDDNRGRVSFPNEDEFRAYYIIFSIHDQRPDLEARVQKWPAELRNSPRVQVALELYAAAANPWEYQGTLDARRPNAIAQGFYTRFFALVDSPSVSYLMACVAEIYFNHVRQTAIRSIWKAYCRYPASQQHKNEEWTIDELTAVLYFDDPDQTIEFCEGQDLELAENSNGELYLNWGSRPVDSVAFQPSSDHAFSEKSVESKRAGRTLVAVILGLNVEEAASRGMLDTSLLPKRDATLASADDDSLFVSQDSDDIQPITNGNLPDTISSSGAQDSASGLRQAVEQSAQLPSNGQSAFQGDGSMPPSWGLNSQRPSEPPRNFSSVFSAGTANTASPFAVSTTTPSTAPSNPFGALPSPFTSNKAAEDEKGPSMFSTSPAPQPAPSATPPNPFATSPAPFTSNKAQEGPKENALFPISSAQNPAHTFPTSPGQSQFTGRQDNTATNTTAPASITPQFKLPSFTQPISSPVSTTPQSTLPAFSQPTFNPPTTTDSNKNANLTPGQTSASIFDSAKPSPICISSSSPFSVPSQDTEPKETTLKERPAEPASPVFSFPGQSAAPNEMYASEHAAEPAPAFNFPTQSATQPARFAQETPFPRFSSSAPSALFPPRQAETEPAFPSTAPETTPSSSIFSNATPPQVSTPEKADFGNLGVFGSTITPEKQEKDMPASQEQISSHPGHRYVQHGPLDSTGASGDLTLPSDPKESEAAEPPNDDVDTSPLSWVNMLRGAALRRRQEPTPSRKRIRDETQEQEPEETSPKAPKMPKPDVSTTPRKPSLALSSIKPLPKLPILEKIDSLAARKPAKEKQPEKPKINQIDEDELLLSAARIAAESMRSGPRLLDGLSTLYQPGPSSFSPGRSFSSSLPASGAGSPQSHAGRYDVAYAPDTNLGLGRTMSRTEQRIRMTGGKGLAYKPLDFTPEKKRKLKGKEMK